jgi:hypothetical protein
MRKQIVALSCAIGVVLTALAYSADTSAAPFTQVPVSVRMMGLCGAGSALGDPATAYNNPAVLGYAERSEISAVHGSILESVPFLGLGYTTEPEALWGMTGGLTFVNVSLGNFKEANVDLTSGEIWQTGRTFGYNAFDLSGSLAKKINDKLALGLNVKMIREALDDKSAAGYGIDLGSFYKWDEKLTLAFALQNIIAPQLAWNTDDKVVETVALRPLFGAAYKALDTLTLVGDIYNDSTQTLAYSVGAEYVLTEMFTVRAGTNMKRFALGTSLRLENILLNVSFSPEMGDSLGMAYFVGGSYLFDLKKTGAVPAPVVVPAPVAPAPEPEPVPVPVVVPAPLPEAVTPPVVLEAAPTVDVVAPVVTETVSEVSASVNTEVIPVMVEVSANTVSASEVVSENIPVQKDETDVLSKENFLKRRSDF